MKTKSLLVLAGIGAPLILSSAASADVSIITVKKSIEGFENFVSMVVNVYVLFDGTNSATNNVHGVGVLLGGPEANVSIRDGIFFQVGPPFGGILAPDPLLFPFAPELVVDTFLTIGRKTGPQGTGPNDDGTGLTPFFPGEDGVPTSEGVWTSTRLSVPDGAWFAGPWLSQAHVNNGVPGSPNGINTILIGQFSIAAGAGPNAGVFGSMLVKGTNTGVAFARLLSFDSQLPAPGALAVLGSAGLLGCRRRRLR